MNVALFMRAFATENVLNPEIAHIHFDDAMATRLLTLSGMVREFSLENISDRCAIAWGDSKWMASNTMYAPLVFTTRTECWWSCEIVTQRGSASVFTERVNITRLFDACEKVQVGELIFSEVTPIPSVVK